MRHTIESFSKVNVYSIYFIICIISDHIIMLRQYFIIILSILIK